MTLVQLEEQERLRTLHDHELLDTSPEGRFDGLVALAATFLDLPIAFFSLVDGDRIWFKAKYGTEADEVGRDLSFCARTVELRDVLIVGDATKDERFSENALVRGEPYIRFYAGVPIRASNGHVLGTLCVLGLEPRMVTREELDVLRGLAREIEAQVELRQLLRKQQAVLDERAILTDMIVHDASGVVAALRWTLKQLEARRGDAALLLAQCYEAVDELMRLCEAVLRRNEDGSRMLPINPVPTRLGPWFEALGRRASNLSRK